MPSSNGCTHPAHVRPMSGDIDVGAEKSWQETWAWYSRKLGAPKFGVEYVVEWISKTREARRVGVEEASSPPRVSQVPQLARTRPSLVTTCGLSQIGPARG